MLRFIFTFSFHFSFFQSLTPMLYIGKFVSKISQEQLHLGFWNLVYLNQVAGAYLVLYFFNFLSFEFQNLKFFVTFFCEAYKVETWYTHGQRVDQLCTPNACTSSQNILVPLFFFFFLSLQLAETEKNLHLKSFSEDVRLWSSSAGRWSGGFSRGSPIFAPCLWLTRLKMSEIILMGHKTQIKNKTKKLQYHLSYALRS